MTTKLARGAFLKNMAGMRHGALRWTDGAESRVFGDPASDLQAEIRVQDESFYRKLVTGGEDGAGDAYVDGLWTSPDPVAVVRFAIRNLESLESGNRISSFVSRMLNRLAHLKRDNTVEGSRRNIHEHYDLSNDFFRLFLDRRMVYSAAIYEHEDTPLEDAQMEKIDRLCRKLGLKPGDHVLEIGTGWGGFALHAAERYGCRVTTTTISREQHHTARQRFDASDLNQQITLLQQDYRDLRGQFDKLASIEMIEAVGYRYFDRFFEQCGRLLRPDGTLVLQAIVMPEHGYSKYLRSVDFIQRYVFPGGCLPSVAAMLESAGRTTNLKLVQVEDFSSHYAETLRRWRTAFEASLEEVRRLGYPESFIRLWRYYLCYCEAAFEENCVGLVHLQFDKPARYRNSFPKTKDVSTRN